MKLYYAKGACSLAPNILLREAGIKFDLEPVNLKTKHYHGGDFTKVNPKGYVPTLQLDNGEILTEAAVILQYVSDQKPEKSLLPKAGTFERYRALEWLNFVATEMHKGFSPLWNEKMPEEAKELAKAKLDTRFEVLKHHFENNAYLMGTQYTAPDAYLFTVLSWAPHVKVDLTRFPSLLGYVERVKNRPATMAALEAEGLIKPL